MNSWNSWQTDIINDIKNQGIENFRNFARLHDTMLPKDMYWHVTSKYIDDDTIKLLRDNSINDSDFYGLTQQFYNLCIFKSIGADINKISSIIEFGGGYGALAHLFRLLGFTGKYIIYDLSVMSQIQHYYLNSYNINNVQLVNDLPEENIDVLIGCWSLSESIPRKAISDFNVNEMWIAYQMSFDGINNDTYFREGLVDYKSTHAPHHSESYYIVGKPKVSYLESPVVPVKR